MSGAVLALLSGSRDVIPDAVNWANVSGAHGSDQSNADQTITGISVPISLLFTSTSNSPALSAWYVKNGAAKVAICTAGSPDPTLGITVGTFSSGDTLHFVFQAAGAFGAATITIQNASYLNQTMDTFTVTLS